MHESIHFDFSMSLPFLFSYFLGAPTYKRRTESAVLWCMTDLWAHVLIRSTSQGCMLMARCRQVGLVWFILYCLFFFFSTLILLTCPEYLYTLLRATLCYCDASVFQGVCEPLHYYCIQSTVVSMYEVQVVLK